MLGFKDITKVHVVLYVPGMAVRVENRRWIAVLVKNATMIAKLIELEFFQQYLATSLKILLKNKGCERVTNVKLYPFKTLPFFFIS